LLLGICITPLGSSDNLSIIIGHWTHDKDNNFLVPTNSSVDVSLNNNSLVYANLSGYAGTNISWSGGQFHSIGVGGVGSGGNPFNQDLNTSDGVAFNDVTLNQFIIGAFGGAIDLSGDPWYMSGADWQIAQDLILDGYVLSDLLPNPTLSRDLGSGAYRWENIFGANGSFDDLNATHGIGTLGDIYVGGITTVNDLIVENKIIGNNFGCRVTNDTTQSIPKNTWTKLHFDSEVYDTDSLHDNTTDNTRLTCTESGIYMINGQVQWSSMTGTQYLVIYLNNESQIARVSGTNTYSFMNDVTTMYNLEEGDYVELMVYHTSSTDEDIIKSNTGAGGYYSPEFMMQRISG